MEGRRALFRCGLLSHRASGVEIDLGPDAEISMDNDASPPGSTLEIIWTEDVEGSMGEYAEEILRHRDYLLLAGGITLVLVQPDVVLEGEGSRPVRARLDVRANVLRIAIGTDWYDYSLPDRQNRFVETIITAQVEALVGPLEEFLAGALQGIRPLLPSDGQWWSRYQEDLIGYLIHELERQGRPAPFPTPDRVAMRWERVRLRDRRRETLSRSEG